MIQRFFFVPRSLFSYIYKCMLCAFFLWPCWTQRKNCNIHISREDLFCNVFEFIFNSVCEQANGLNKLVWAIFILLLFAELFSLFLQQMYFFLNLLVLFIPFIQTKTLHFGRARNSVRNIKNGPWNGVPKTIHMPRIGNISKHSVDSFNPTNFADWCSSFKRSKNYTKLPIKCFQFSLFWIDVKFLESYETIN